MEKRDDNALLWCGVVFGIMEGNMVGEEVQGIRKSVTDTLRIQ